MPVCADAFIILTRHLLFLASTVEASNDADLNIHSESEGINASSKRPVEGIGIKKGDNNNNNVVGHPPAPTAMMTVPYARNSTPISNSNNGGVLPHLNAAPMLQSRSATHPPDGSQETVSVYQPPSRFSSIAPAPRGGGDTQTDKSPHANVQDRNSETPLVPSSAPGESLGLPPVLPPLQQLPVVENQQKSKSPDGAGQAPEEKDIVPSFWSWLDETVRRPEKCRKEADRLQGEAATHRVESEKLKEEKKRREKEQETKEMEIERVKKELEKMKKDLEKLQTEHGNSKRDTKRLDEFISFHEAEERHRLEKFNEQLKQEEDTKQYLHQFGLNFLQKFKMSGVKLPSFGKDKENNPKP